MLKTAHKRAKRNQPKQTLKMELCAGDSIGFAARQALQLARRNNAEVVFKFNDILMRVRPQEDNAKAIEARYMAAMEAERKAWRASAAGKAYAGRRALELAKRQDTVTAAIRGLPGLLALQEADIAPLTRSDMVVSWLNSFVEDADDVDIDWNKATGLRRGGKEWLATLFISAGYRESDLVGEPAESFNTRERMGRYIVGQAIHHLRQGMPPHPVLQRFAKDYFALPA